MPLQPADLAKIDQLNTNTRAEPVIYNRPIKVTSPVPFSTVPIRSTQSTIGKAINQAFAAQQQAQNAAAQAAAAANAITGGLALGQGLIQQFTGLVAGQIVGKNCFYTQ